MKECRKSIRSEERTDMRAYGVAKAGTGLLIGVGFFVLLLFVDMPMIWAWPAIPICSMLAVIFGDRFIVFAKDALRFFIGGEV